jgi:hypothetical protein
MRVALTPVIRTKLRSIVFVYAVVALIGGLISCVLLWAYGAAVALLGIPFGGSLFALAVAP